MRRVLGRVLSRVGYWGFGRLINRLEWLLDKQALEKHIYSHDCIDLGFGDDCSVLGP